MLIPLTITHRTKSEKSTGVFVFNTAFITELVTVSGVARFKYLGQPENKRGQSEEITVAETVATIRTAINLDYAVNALTLNVYPEEDTSEDTVPTTFLINEVVLAWQMGSDYSTADGTGFKTYVLINEKGNIKRYLVDNHYLDLISYAETASTSTYTTS